MRTTMLRSVCLGSWCYILALSVLPIEAANPLPSIVPGQNEYQFTIKVAQATPGQKEFKWVYGANPYQPIRASTLAAAQEQLPDLARKEQIRKFTICKNNHLEAKAIFTADPQKIRAGEMADKHQTWGDQQRLLSKYTIIGVKVRTPDSKVKSGWGEWQESTDTSWKDVVREIPSEPALGSVPWLEDSGT